MAQQEIKRPPVNVFIATTVMLSFISFWRAAAIVLSDLASSAYYAGGDAEKIADGVAKLVRAPLRVVRTGFVDVADGDSLHVRLFEKMKHHAHALRANADEGEIEFVARRDIAEAAENVARHDGETKAGGGGLREEFAA